MESNRSINKLPAIGRRRGNYKKKKLINVSTSPELPRLTSSYKNYPKSPSPTITSPTADNINKRKLQKRILSPANYLANIRVSPIKLVVVNESSDEGAIELFAELNRHKA